MADYETMSRAELTKLRKDIDRAIATVGDRDKRNALKAAEAAAREHGFSLTDLQAAMAPGKRTRGSAKPEGTDEVRAVRFRNPEDHTQTWSGRGRRPAWYNEALAADRPIDDLQAE